MSRTKTERLTDVASLVHDAFECQVVPMPLKMRLYILYVKIWATVVPKPVKREGR